jgi:hypothetical protein
MRQLQSNIFISLSLFVLQGCGSGSDEDNPVPGGGSEDSPPSLACGASQLHSAYHDGCAAMDVQGQDACNCTSMGWTWNGSACVALDAGFCECVGKDCDKLAKSKEECETSHAACSNSLKSIACGSSVLRAMTHDSCGKMDARGEGACYCLSMGWIWDGAACAELGAGYCRCLGEDCDKLSPTKQDCLSQHALCL